MKKIIIPLIILIANCKFYSPFKLHNTIYCLMDGTISTSRYNHIVFTTIIYNIFSN